MKSKLENTTETQPVGFEVTVTADTIKRMDEFYKSQGEIVKQERILDRATGLRFIHSTFSTGHVGVMLDEPSMVVSGKCAALCRLTVQ